MRDHERPGRSVVRACDGMISASNPLAAAAGLGVLRDGGNAVDAAIAAMAVLGVVETLNVGLGGDCFALYAPHGGPKIVAYNGSGRAPAAADPARLRSAGHTAMPNTGPHPVTVPGAVEAWERLAHDHGTRGLNALLAPAIAYAEAGYPVHEVIAEQWRRAADRLRGDAEARRLFLWNDAAPRPGAVHRQPDLAATMRAIAHGGAAAFYQGVTAARIVACLRGLGGLHTLEDFATHRGDYVAPVGQAYRGHVVHECPPNGQGIAALMMLGLLERFDIAALDLSGAAHLHLMIEAGRLAIADRDRLVGDPAETSWHALLAPAYLDTLASRIDPRRAVPPRPPASLPMGRDTCHVAVVDRDRNAMSMIGSVFEDFGSGLVAPGTGVLLQNRGAGFVLTPGHPNEFGPRRRPLHTIIPALVTHAGRVRHVLGVVGGHYQAWGHAHVISRLLDFGDDVQAALDAPRAWHNGRSVEVERGLAAAAIAGLQSRGHDLLRHDDPAAGWPLGGAQLIEIDWQSGTLSGAADPRLDGCALGH
jgi:gamma-glutamyltranspeptidase / glutathione hydrolase